MKCNDPNTCQNAATIRCHKYNKTICFEHAQYHARIFGCGGGEHTMLSDEIPGAQPKA